MAQQPQMGQKLLIIEASRSHSDTLWFVRLLWTSDQPFQRPLTDNTHTYKRQIFIPAVGFEPVVQSKRVAAEPRLRLAATGTDTINLYYG